jgi:L-ascorbate metabolism protein UlaG (beta-lactamase superfamily)
MRYTISAFIIVGVLAACACRVSAEEPARVRISPLLSDKDDHYISRQADVFLKRVREVLAQFPPTPKPGLERKMAFSLLDAVTHETYAPNRPELIAFHHERIGAAVAEIESTTVSEGARIWQLYNHGFVVKTKTVTLGFDLFRGPSRTRGQDLTGEIVSIPTPEFPIHDDVAKRLAAQCDVLFISHLHQDHADPFIAREMIEQGKPVVATTETFADAGRYKDLGFDIATVHNHLTFMARKVHEVQKLPVQQGKIVLDIIVNPGHQEKALCNNVVVKTPEGLTFVHNGDQYNDPTDPEQKDFEWIDQMGDHSDIDVVMTNCWMEDPLRYVEGTRPKLTIFGHMIEMGHPCWDRMAYWGDAEYIQSTYDKLLASDHPVLIMAWGESYHYMRPAP